MGKTTTVIWDWNGTLLDDAPVCLAAVNSMLRERGLPQLSAERYQEIFCFPVSDYYRKAGFDFEKEPFERLAVLYHERYLAASERCPLCEGALETLRELQRRGVRQAVLSASHQRHLLWQMGLFDIQGYFDEVLGIEDIYARSKAELGQDFVRRRGLDPAGVLLVGDTEHDCETARAIGCRCLLIPGGHQSPERLRRSGATVLSSRKEILEYL